MATSKRLRVHVNDELLLDAGTCEEVSGPHGPEKLIRPPETALFHQVLTYLRAKPDPPTQPSGSMVGREGVAAAALVLRWGSYLAVLLDRDKPVWSEALLPRTSRISDEEMARINIEASAALAEWIDLYRADSGGPIYTRLVDRAISYLPMPTKTARFKSDRFAALADPDTAARLAEAAGTVRVAHARVEAQRYASRVFANALVSWPWPVEAT